MDITEDVERADGCSCLRLTALELPSELRRPARDFEEIVASKTAVKPTSDRAAAGGQYRFVTGLPHLEGGSREAHR